MMARKIRETFCIGVYAVQDDHFPKKRNSDIGARDTNEIPATGPPRSERGVHELSTLQADRKVIASTGFALATLSMQPNRYAKTQFGCLSYNTWQITFSWSTHVRWHQIYPMALWRSNYATRGGKSDKSGGEGKVSTYHLATLSGISFGKH